MNDVTISQSYVTLEPTMLVTFEFNFKIFIYATFIYFTCNNCCRHSSVDHQHIYPHGSQNQTDLQCRGCYHSDCMVTKGVWDLCLPDGHTRLKPKL